MLGFTKKQLKNLASGASLAAFALLIVGVGKLGTVERPTKALTGAEALAGRHENARFTARLVGHKPAKSGGISLDMRTQEGLKVTVFASKDVGFVELSIGATYELKGSSMGQGAYSLNRPGALTLLPDAAIASKTQRVRVQHGWGLVETALGAQRVPMAESTPDGIHERVLVADSSGQPWLQSSR